MAAKLRKGDKVVVLAGKDKGKEGTIASVDPKANKACLLYTSPSPRDPKTSRMPSSA